MRNARFRQYHAKLTVVPGDFDVDDFGVARAQAAQFMAYGAGIVWIVEPLLALMIRRPEATPAGIPAGDPRIGPGSKCNAVRHSFPPAFCVRATPQHWPVQNRRHRTRSGPKKDTPLRDAGARRTVCWREMDSNHRSPVRTAFPAEIVRRCVGLVLTLRWRKPDSNSPSHLNEKLR